MTRTQLDSESPWVPAPVSLSLLFYFFKVLKIFLNFYCSLADLQCCVSFYCNASSPLHTNLQVVNLRRCGRVFARLAA